MGKFLLFQDITSINMPCTLTTELNEILLAHSKKMKEIVQGQGSVFATHVDSMLLASYLNYTTCPLHELDACAKNFITYLREGMSTLAHRYLTNMCIQTGE